MSFKFNGNFSKEKIRLITNQMSDYLKVKGINGKITSSLFYDDISWRSSQFSNIGNEKNKDCLPRKTQTTRT